MKAVGRSVRPFRLKNGGPGAKRRGPARGQRVPFPWKEKSAKEDFSRSTAVKVGLGVCRVVCAVSRCLVVGDRVFGGLSPQNPQNALPEIVFSESRVYT